jgi:hypothetical protein
MNLNCLVKLNILRVIMSLTIIFKIKFIIYKSIIYYIYS